MEHALLYQPKQHRPPSPCVHAFNCSAARRTARHDSSNFHSHSKFFAQPKLIFVAITKPSSDATTLSISIAHANACTNLKSISFAFFDPTTNSFAFTQPYNMAANRLLGFKSASGIWLRNSSCFVDYFCISIDILF